jgi:hypothetical protein
LTPDPELANNQGQPEPSRVTAATHAAPSFATGDTDTAAHSK